MASTAPAAWPYSVNSEDMRYISSCGFSIIHTSRREFALVSCFVREPWLTDDQPAGNSTSIRNVTSSFTKCGYQKVDPLKNIPSGEIIPGDTLKLRAYSSPYSSTG